MKLTYLTLVLVSALVVVSVGSVAAVTPTTINYQGRLTDSAGSPVPDGPYSLDFKLFDAPIAGNLLWSEVGVGVSTINGLFTTVLGYPNPFPAGMYDSYAGYEDIFQHAPELWLEIKVGSTTLSPRTPLQAVPYSVTANSLSGKFGSAGIESNTFGALIENFGFDGNNRFKLGDVNFGHLSLYDLSADLAAELSANAGSGAYMHLFDSTGNNTISLNAGGSGDVSVYLPKDGINSLEMLNEPGIAVGKGGGFPLVSSSTSQDIATVTITIPSSGYISLDGYAYLVHNGGPTCLGWVQISDSSNGPMGINSVWTGSDYSSATSGANYQVAPVKMTTFKVAGTYTFYLQGNAYISNSGGATVVSYTPCWIQATYFPTSYGSVSSLAASAPTDNPDVKPESITDPLTRQSRTVYSVDLRYYELRAEREQAEALKAQLELQAAKAAAAIQSASGEATNVSAIDQK